MLNEKIIVNVEDKEIEVTKGTSLKELSKSFQNNYKLPIILAKVNGIYKELSDTLNRTSTVEFLTLSNKEANRAYVSGLIYLIIYVGKKLFNNNNTFIVQHSIDKGLYIRTKRKITQEDVKLIKKEMKELIKLNLPIEKLNVNRLEAIDYFESIKDMAKVELLKYNTNTFVTLYKLGNLYNFFFSLMPIETRCLERFDLKYLNENGFVLLFQTTYMKEEIKSYEHHTKVFDVFSDFHDWISIMNMETVSSLNKYVSSGNIGDLIRITEVLQSNKLLDIAKTIYSQRNKIKIVLVSGPSSSGKTTTSNKLSMYLRSFGLNPRTLSMDNYYKRRELCPKDENGNYDFESIEALNLELFNKQIKKISEGEEVKIPVYNFITGEPNMESGQIIQLKEKDILIVEGIHALNLGLLEDLPAKSKYKIYIAPFTCLNFDNQNRISTSDNRLLRRIVRDNVCRGNDVEETLFTWENVRLGEEKNIFPYQDEADVLFNTALIYEIGVLKTYVEPLLYSVDIDSPYYNEAKRLINMLKLFLPIPSEDIPKDSILREFIGGSCFKQ